MAQLMDHVTYLSQEIGPRPAGTEEEQRAALYITEQFQKETGFSATMEDFSSPSNVELGLAAMAAIVVLATLLSMFFPVVTIPALILAAAAAAVYSLEEFDRPIISRLLSRGASQNVVAKYQPSNDSEGAVGRRGSARKIILLAHYDTGYVNPSLVEKLEGMKIPLTLVCVAGMIAAAFFLLIRVFIASGGGMGLLVLNVLSVISIIICLYPIVKALLVRDPVYNEGATNNATGTAALIEVARRIARGSVSEAELADAENDVIIHGEEAAREAGLIPEGVLLTYEAEPPAEEPQPADSEIYDEEERLLSAKAAIAALTGRPVENKVYSTITRKPPEIAEADERFVSDGGYDDYSHYDVEARDEAERQDDFGYPAGFEAPAPQRVEAEESIDGFQNAPSWFVAAQQNARKNDSERSGAEPQIKKSRYVEAIENAERSLAEREEEMREAERARRAAAQRAREEELRAAMLAHEEEERRKNAAHAAPQQEAPQVAADKEPVFYPPLGYDAYQNSPADETDQPEVLQPETTAAMPAPTPSAEIIAEALAADPEVAQESQQQLRDVIPSLATTPDSATAVTPEQAQPVESRVTALPSIDPANPYSDSKPTSAGNPSLSKAVPSVMASPDEANEPSKSGILRKLRTSVPSLSGLIAPVSSQPRPSVKGRKAERVDYDMEVSLDAVPEVTPPPKEENSPATAHSRSGSLINKLRRNSDADSFSDTPQQWLNVEEDFDPRTVGRERGGWESFRNDQDPGSESDEPITDASRGEAGRRWQGGAFSRVQLGHVDTRSGEDAEADKPITEEPEVPEEHIPIAEEIEQIYHFRNPMFNTEIWFVAIGSDGESHDGARAFVEEHRDELRGAMMIEIESLGAGTLSVANEEGRIRKTTVSSRVKRYTREATAATGIAVSNVSLVGTDSIASTLQKSGFQAMHLFGAENERPALKGSADDVLENVDEFLLEEHVNFVYELLKR